MTESGLECAVLLADITGSTPLYEKVGDSEAARRIGRCIDWMRDTIEDGGGVFVAAKGDDVLATFQVACHALDVIERILAQMPMGGLSVHAGLHHGTVVSTRGDVFGDVVNLTARLAGSANPGEVLISRDFAMQLPRARAETLRPLNAMTFKGKSEPVDVFSLNEDTQFLAAGRGGDATRLAARGNAAVLLGYGDTRQLVEEGLSVSLGRSPDNDLVIEKPWVSRRHATIAVTGGRVQLTDRSSYGSFLAIDGAVELVARRETVVMTGAGRLSPGASVAHPDAAVIVFEVSVG